MASTTTTIVAPSTISELLQTYDVHHTGEEEEPQRQPNNQRQRQHTLPPTSTSRLLEPADLELEPPSRRRVPPYRAISRNHPLSSRPAGPSAVDVIPVTLMFFGVYIIAGVGRIWRNTGGKINDRIFQYEVGGEW